MFLFDGLVASVFGGGQTVPDRPRETTGVDLPSVPEGLDELQPAQGSPRAGGAVFSWLANDQAKVNPAPEDPSVDPKDPLSPIEEALSAAADPRECHADPSRVSEDRGAPQSAPETAQVGHTDPSLPARQSR
ncbi:hypothetical protein ACLKA7_004875 [Drosophila subpalustris]